MYESLEPDVLGLFRSHAQASKILSRAVGRVDKVLAAAGATTVLAAHCAYSRCRIGCQAEPASMLAFVSAWFPAQDARQRPPLPSMAS